MLLNSQVKGIHFLCNRFPLYAGIYLPDFKSEEELVVGIQAALQNGASGISFFGNVDEKTLSALHDASIQIP